MLDHDQADRPYVKASVYRALHEQFPTRSVKAFEFKMQNISAVMERYELPWVQGLKPKRNIQADLAVAVKNRLVDLGEIEKPR